MCRRRYGSRALELLRRYYEGDLADVVGDADSSDDDDGDEDDDGAAVGIEGGQAAAAAAANGGTIAANGSASALPLQEEVVAPRAGLPPLLVRACRLLAKNGGHRRMLLKTALPANDVLAGTEVVASASIVTCTLLWQLLCQDSVRA